MAGTEGESLLMVDGAARGNPGEAGCGAVIIDESGVVIKEVSRYLGRTTNNVAEYEALLLGLEALTDLGKKRSVYKAIRSFWSGNSTASTGLKMKSSNGSSIAP